MMLTLWENILMLMPNALHFFDDLKYQGALIQILNDTYDIIHMHYIAYVSEI